MLVMVMCPSYAQTSFRLFVLMMGAWLPCW